MDIDTDVDIDTDSEYEWGFYSSYYGATRLHIRSFDHGLYGGFPLGCRNLIKKPLVLYRVLNRDPTISWI